MFRTLITVFQVGQLLTNYLDVCGLVANDFTKGQAGEVALQRAQHIGSETINRLCYSMWAKHAERLGMGHRRGSERLRTYRNFLTTGFGTSHRDRSRDERGGLNRGRSGSRSRSSSRGRSASGSRDYDRPGPSRRRSPDRDTFRTPAKRGRGSYGYGW